MLFDCIERAARNRTARAASQDRGGTAHVHNVRACARYASALLARCPARSPRDSTISPRGEVGTGCAQPSRSHPPRSSCSLTARRVPHAGSAQAGQARPWLNPSLHGLSTAESSRNSTIAELRRLHPPVHPCKENRHSINAMYHCEALQGGNKSVSVVVRPN